MERVDVVVVGGGAAGLSAAWGAAAGGVRAIVIEETELPRPAQGLYALGKRDFTDLGLEISASERVHRLMRVNDRPEVELDWNLAIYVVRGQTIHHQLYTRARGAGAEIRDGATAVGAELDQEGWVVRIAGGEPVRAPVLIIADGARSSMLTAIGLANAQRLSRQGAEVVSTLCATWDLPPSEASKHTMFRAHESRGPLGRAELLPGKDRVTLAVGPVWHGVASRDDEWPANALARGTIARAAKLFDLPALPRTIEVEEWRLDALPSPPVFDGGMVIGGAAGHRPHRPLSSHGALVRCGKVAGRAAAQAVLSASWRADELAAHLGEAHRALVAEVEAEVAYEAHGLRRPRGRTESFTLSPAGA